jgi:outer membrane protein
MRLSKLVMMLSLAFCWLTIGIPSGFCADNAKIGTVNFQKIFENSTTGKAVKAEINAQGQRMEKDLKAKGDEIKALEKRLGDDAGVMSKEAREEQRWEYERKIDEVKALKKKYDRQIQDLQMQRVNGVRQEVLQLIQEYGKKEGYLLIVEDVNVVYAPSNVDLTDEIIKRYNAKK